ncbi:MAG TPA: DUF3501 family protein [Rudaea sp.]
MKKLTPTDLYKLEDYARERNAFRARVIAHKQPRTVHLGPHLTLVFEDRLTIQYQIQEMLRIERIFESEGVRDELDAYNPLIPDGTNLKATMLIEYPDPAERARKLVELHDIENRIALTVAGTAIRAIADEDLGRSTEEKTSAVHFLRFEFDAAQSAAFKHGGSAVLSVEHPAYTQRVTLPVATQNALAADLDG